MHARQVMFSILIEFILFLGEKQDKKIRMSTEAHIIEPASTVT